MNKKIKEINWVMLEGAHGGSRIAINEDQISLTFRKKISKKYSEGIIKGNLKIGNAIVKKIGWEEKDMLGMFHDKDNEMYFMVTKINSGKGLRLKKVSKKCSYHTIDFNWEGKSKPECKSYTHSKPLKFKMDKKCIYFEYKD